MSEWTDELKQQAIDAYKEQNPTPATSTEIVKQIAEDMGMSPNGVRMVLSTAKVYIKNGPSAEEGKAKGKAGEAKAPRVSKDDCINALRAAITAAGKEVDDEIVSKLTGKAAVYFTSLFE